ncbi:MAG: hypothetical protein ACJA0I_002002 [Gammaproteobacteria bacterium]|jgi:hypothetical protein
MLRLLHFFIYLVSIFDMCECLRILPLPILIYQKSISKIDFFAIAAWPSDNYWLANLWSNAQSIRNFPSKNAT